MQILYINVRHDVCVCVCVQRGGLRVNLLSHNNPEGGSVFLSGAHLLLNKRRQDRLQGLSCIKAFFFLVLILLLKNFLDSLVNSLMDVSV